MAKPPLAFQQLATFLRKLPGVGTKTAERYAFALLDWDPTSLQNLSHSIGTFLQKMQKCSHCLCLKGDELCMFCDKPREDPNTLCIVASPKDIYPLEETGAFRGLYHVLEGLFSPIQGRHACTIDIKRLRHRVEKHHITDILLALDATLDGDATALLLKQEMQTWNVSLSRLAFGLPIGSALEYTDPGTLARALLGKHPF